MTNANTSGNKSNNSVVDTQTTTEAHESYPVGGFENFGDFGEFHPPEDETQGVDNTTDSSFQIIDKMLEESDLFNTTNDDIDTEEEGCHCRPPPDVFCRCFGQSVTRIPSNLTLGLTRL